MRNFVEMSCGEGSGTFEGIAPIEDVAVLKVQPFSEMGRPVELLKSFGGKAQYQQALKELEKRLYY